MNRSGIIIGLVFMLMSGTSLIAADLNLSGYYENNLQADYTENTSEAILDASKLRLDFKAGGTGDELKFTGNINFIRYHGPVSRDIRPYLPESVTSQLDSLAGQLGPLTELLPQLESFTVFSFPEERFYLDNAFLTWRKGSLRVRAGKQQLSWGPGYIFNPTDLFHRKDMIDPTYEKEGVTALRTDYYWGIGGQLSLITAFDDRFDEAGYALRAGTHISAIGYDVAVTLHQVTDSTSYELVPFEMPSDLVTESIIYPQTRYQRRQAVGFDCSGELLGLGVWFEGNYNLMEHEDDFFRAVFGTDYTLMNGIYLMAEGLYNGRGKWDAPYSLESWLANLTFGEPVSRLMILTGIRHDLSDLLIGSLYAFGGLDGGYVINPRIDYSLAQNADLTVFGAITFGEEDSQFPPGLYSAIARATVYF